MFTKSIVPLLTIIIALSSTLCAELKYRQYYTISNSKSLALVKKDAEEFCAAAYGEPYIEIKNVTYCELSGTYQARISCRVSEVDKDFMKISEKIFQKKQRALK